MSNEDKILTMLGELKADIGTMKADIEKIKQNNLSYHASILPMVDKQRQALARWNSLPDDDEMKRFCKFMDAEEARKAALYGD